MMKGNNVFSKKDDSISNELKLCFEITCYNIIPLLYRCEMIFLNQPLTHYFYYTHYYQHRHFYL